LFYHQGFTYTVLDIIHIPGRVSMPIILATIYCLQQGSSLG
jgi:hypothetical protein